jgi:hypothetical protein
MLVQVCEVAYDPKGDVRAFWSPHTTIKSLPTMVSPLKYFATGARQVSSSMLSMAGVRCDSTSVLTPACWAMRPTSSEGEWSAFIYAMKASNFTGAPRAICPLMRCHLNVVEMRRYRSSDDRTTRRDVGCCGTSRNFACNARPSGRRGASPRLTKPHSSCSIYEYAAWSEGLGTLLGAQTVGVELQIWLMLPTSGAVLPTGAKQQSRFCPELRYDEPMFHFLDAVRAARLAIVGRDEDIDQT